MSDPTPLITADRSSEAPRPSGTMAVLVVGFAGASFPGCSPAMALTGSADATLDELVDAIEVGLDATGAALVLYPRWAGANTASRVRTARRIVGSGRVVGRPVDLPPLAGAVLAALVAAAAPFAARPGDVLASATVLERQLPTVAWLRRVGGLRSPGPTLRQHVASWLPWTRFVAWTGEDPGVATITRDLATVPDRAETHPGWGWAVAGDVPAGVSWVRAALGPTGGTVTELPPSPLGRRWWGTAPVVEAVAHPSSLDGVLAALRPVPRLTTCEWCGDDVPGAPCPFCAMATALPAPVTAVSAEQPSAR